VRRLLAPAAIAVLLAAAGAAGFLAGRGEESSEPPPATVATGTATVVRTDLVRTETLAGRLRYADPVTVRTQLGGTVTALPEEATRLERGGVVFELDGQPVFLWFGTRPAWRAFRDGMTDGPDVAQLEENLAALGYEVTVDEEFDDATGDALEAWREDAGLPEGRALELGRVVFLPGAGRVGSRAAEVGQVLPPGSPVLELSAFRQEVVIDLDPGDLDLVAEGDRVTVVLPADREVAGEIASVGRVVVPSGPEPGSPRVLEVLVSLSEPVLDLDQAPVDVDVVSEAVEGVLAVPVSALLSLDGGGYAVEVVRGADTELIGVEIGTFAAGLVEVSGGLAEGDVVVVPR
jgi:hypothetical protein